MIVSFSDRLSIQMCECCLFNQMYGPYRQYYIPYNVYFLSRQEAVNRRGWLCWAGGVSLVWWLSSYGYIQHLETRPTGPCEWALPRDMAMVILSVEQWWLCTYVVEHLWIRLNYSEFVTVANPFCERCVNDRWQNVNNRE